MTSAFLSRRSFILQCVCNCPMRGPHPRPVSSILFRKTLPSRLIFVLLLVTLRTLHPELKEELRELRKHLVESTNEMAPLKVWQMQGESESAEIIVQIGKYKKKKEICVLKYLPCTCFNNNSFSYSFHSCHSFLFCFWSTCLKLLHVFRAALTLCCDERAGVSPACFALSAPVF